MQRRNHLKIKEDGYRIYRDKLASLFNLNSDLFHLPYNRLYKENQECEVWTYLSFLNCQIAEKNIAGFYVEKIFQYGHLCILVRIVFGMTLMVSFYTKLLSYYLISTRCCVFFFFSRGIYNTYLPAFFLSLKQL